MLGKFSRFMSLEGDDTQDVVILDRHQDGAQVRSPLHGLLNWTSDHESYWGCGLTAAFSHWDFVGRHWFSSLPPSLTCGRSFCRSLRSTLVPCTSLDRGLSWLLPCEAILNDFFVSELRKHLHSPF